MEVFWRVKIEKITSNSVKCESHFKCSTHEFLSFDSIVNKQYYLGIMNNLRENILGKQPIILRDLVDFAPIQRTAHIAVLIQQLLTKHNVLVMSHPRYSPDMTACEPRIFLVVENALIYLQNIQGGSLC